MSDVLRDRDDDGRRASHVAESVLVLVLGHLADDWRALLILGDFWFEWGAAWSFPFTPRL